jgi:hypothetical protein
VPLPDALDRVSAEELRVPLDPAGLYADDEVLVWLF